MGCKRGGQSGGLGAKIMGNFNLSKDSVLKLVVGQSGGTAGNDKTTSEEEELFVIKHPYNNNASILVIAGGGGGSHGENDFQSGNHDDGQVTNFGSRGYGQSFSLGGSNGAGGSSTNRATGGGGFYTNGSNNNQDQGMGPEENRFLMEQEVEDKYSTPGVDGGFGGGGNGMVTGFRGSGGGGGYSGGGTGTRDTASIDHQGGGGGSYNSGTDQVNAAGVNAEHGKVVITFLSLPTYNFTNAGASGREGPTQSQISTNYSGTNLADKVTINTRGIQEWTVPESGTYSIEAWGAQGGSTQGTQEAKVLS